jgi:hypothetical protein
MGKFKDRRGHSRWQEARNDIKAFIDKHDDQAGPILKGLAKVVAPRAAHIIDAISEVREARADKAAKERTLAALQQTLDDLDDDDAPESIEASPLAIDPNKLANSTAVSKYLSSVVLVLVTIIFTGMWATEIGHYWGLCPNGVDPLDKATISAVFGSLVGLRQIIRGEVKKKILAQ